MGILTAKAQQAKVNFFFSNLPKDVSILEVGSGSGWLKKALNQKGFINYTSLDIVSPADYNGDINDWEKLGLKVGSFDVIVAFEVIEHDDIEKACFDLLKLSGKLFVTTPIPHMDWVLKIMESIGLNQRRTSPHSHLLYLKKDLKFFDVVRYKAVASLGQWAVLEKS